MANGNDFLSLKEYVKTLKHKAFSKRRALSDAESISDSNQINEYLKNYYKKASAVNSFMDENGQIWDCMGIAEQPSLRGRKDRRFERPPKFERELYVDSDAIRSAGDAKEDAYGNRMECPDGYVPIRRMTPEQIMNAGGLNKYLKKTSQISVAIHRDLSADSAFIDGDRHYAVARQFVLNNGGTSVLNLWQPRLEDNSEVLSLSQIWIAGGRGETTQTIEVGWQVSPGKFGRQPVLFIYWTPDNYNTGSYNLEQKDTFVQRDFSWRLGGAISPTSIYDGNQYDLQVDWLLYDRAWWLYVNGTPIGYYPQRLFGNGPLSKIAESIVVGGEVGSNGRWPPMGSGHMAREKFGRAAYSRNINYTDSNGVIRTMQPSRYVTAPAFYEYLAGTEPTWGTSFFFGGPGDV